MTQTNHIGTGEPSPEPPIIRIGREGNGIERRYYLTKVPKVTIKENKTTAGNKITHKD